MLYFPTIMSVLEVLAVTIPVLLTVAFVTIAERKTMASMQRRVGPNHTGFKNHIGTLCYYRLYTKYPFKNICYTNTFTIRPFHTSNSYSSKNNQILESLLISRLATVIPFSHPILITCDYILNLAVKT
jgi:NADH:ubiquinone oxidoreductase subunit H